MVFAATFWLSLAVMVTFPLAGPSATLSDQLQVPFVLFWATVPTLAVIVTVALPCESENVPVFETVPPSLALTAAALAWTTGGVFGFT